MPKTSSHPASRVARRGTLERPLDALVFLLPMILFYELTCSPNERVIAFEMLYRFLRLFGPVGFWAPGLAVVTILLATHAASRDRWVIHWRRAGWMYVESMILALPLLILIWSIQSVPGQRDPRVLHPLTVGVGAGIYEELVFRLVLISVIVIVAADFLRLPRTRVAVAAVILSSLAFAAHHHPPIGSDPFRVAPFLFRTMAGIYLAAIFWFRGYGPAAGCHAAYNVALVGIDLITP